MSVVIAIVMVPFWFILKKAGLSPWLSLMCIIPSLGTVILLYVLAFSDWKVVPAPLQAWMPQPPIHPSRLIRRRHRIRRRAEQVTNSPLCCTMQTSDEF